MLGSELSENQNSMKMPNVSGKTELVAALIDAAPNNNLSSISTQNGQWKQDGLPSAVEMIVKEISRFY